MKLEYQGKRLEYNMDGSLKGTVVMLGHLEGGCLPVLLLGDKTALNNQELFELALEKHYEENFALKAENEKFVELNKKIEQIEEENAAKRLGENREAYLNQLVQTSQNIMAAQGTLRAVKKNSNKFTDTELVDTINTLLISNFQAVDLLRSVITILK